MSAAGVRPPAGALSTRTLGITFAAGAGEGDEATGAGAGAAGVDADVEDEVDVAAGVDVDVDGAGVSVTTAAGAASASLAAGLGAGADRGARNSFQAVKQRITTLTAAKPSENSGPDHEVERWAPRRGNAAGFRGACIVPATTGRPGPA
ncbi:MAG: hypothetical protein FJ102_01485, partial [Deltaproteobacteria bacterium]|nr:hypothetical protein [Deltaproteobacteria bacterium]